MALPSQTGERPSRPVPSHRHGAPSGPWPWCDLDSDLDAVSDPEREPSCHHTIGECHGCWARYPQLLFPNWTPGQVRRSGIANICARTRSEGPCLIHHVDVHDDEKSTFSAGRTQSVSEQNMEDFWKVMQETKRPDDIRVRALFVDNLSMPVLQMLGTKYIIDPFFFSSSLNWIPSRYQENAQPSKGDHITITLTFLRAKKRGNTVSSASSQTAVGTHLPAHVANEAIDTQASLILEAYELQLDLLAVHMVRSTENNTIITYHPSPATANHLHSRVLLVGESVYWQNIFRKTVDPTFVLLTILWYALYAWDEALEKLWEHIGRLELDVMSTNNMNLTRELHKLSAHLLHYTSLLEDFRQSVSFVLETRNPAMDSTGADQRALSGQLLKNECNNLFMQIARLEVSRAQQDERLTNVMKLVFSTVNIDDSKTMRKLTEEAVVESAAMKELTELTVRDSEAMKQIAYVTMVFLPATFVSGIFGMNIQELNPTSSYGTFGHFLAAALSFTFTSAWIILAFQGKFHRDAGRDLGGIASRLRWPVDVIRRFFVRRDNLDRNHVQMQDNIGYINGETV